MTTVSDAGSWPLQWIVRGAAVSWMLAGSPGRSPGVGVGFCFAAAATGGNWALPPLNPNACAPSRPNSNPPKASNAPTITTILVRMATS
jgi:hypothetical protein